MADVRGDPVARWLSGIAVVILTFILAWGLIASANTPSIDERLSQIEEQLTYVSCLLLIPTAERPERGIAECQMEIGE